MVTQDELQVLLTTDLKTFFHDTFLSTEHMDEHTAQTGNLYRSVQQLKLETGVQEGSVCRVCYVRPFFNPLYSRLLFKLRLSSMDDIDLFAGFKYGTSHPLWAMKESHAGLQLDYANDNGTLYFSTGDGDVGVPKHQGTPIKDIDMKRWLVFEIDGYKLRWYSLPYTVPYFDKNVLPGLKQGIIRKWSPVYTNGSIFPANQVHYIYFFIRNRTGTNKSLELQFINYAEVYPD